MFSSNVLEVAIGLVFVYLLFSLFCSAINEWIARLFELRGRTLRNGLNSLLVDGQGLAAEFHEHPLISGLAQKNNRPAYIPSQTFALALMDLAVNVTPGAGGAPGTVGVNAKANSKTAAPISDSAQKLLKSLLQGAASDATAVQQRLEKWFADSMERVSGWYKRRTQIILVILAVLVCAGFDVDTIRIVKRLQTDSAFRESLLKQAQETVKNTKLDDVTWQQDLYKAKLPIGWDSEKEGGFTWKGLWHLSKAAGLLLSAIALSLGSPFWFDTLNKLVNLRQSGIPPDEQKNSKKK